jgi:putative transposon-encoded protein
MSKINNISKVQFPEHFLGWKSVLDVKREL